MIFYCTVQHFRNCWRGSIKTFWASTPQDSVYGS